MTLEGLVIWLLIGLSAGWLAGMFMRGRGYGIGGNIVIGVTGSILGGLLMSLSGLGASNVLGSIIVAFVGAVFLILIVRSLPGRSTI